MVDGGDLYVFNQLLTKGVERLLDETTSAKSVFGCYPSLFRCPFHNSNNEQRWLLMMKDRKQRVVFGGVVFCCCCLAVPSRLPSDLKFAVLRSHLRDTPTN
jgi:hypothetical protein